MSNKKPIWIYIDELTNQSIGPVTIEQLDALRREGRIEDFTQVVSQEMLRQQGPMAQGVPYSLISRIDVEFEPELEELCDSRADKIVTVLSGPNNSGKTLILKNLWAIVGRSGYLVSCNRFSHVDQLNSRKIDKDDHRRFYDNFINSYNMAQNNSENNELQLEQVITSLKDRQRDVLFELCEQLIGNRFSLQRTDPENQFSSFYVDMDGENLRYGSSGTRLLLTLLGILLDGRFSVVLIDEPELSLSPRIQAVLANLMFDPERRREYFPHLKQLYIATHSHLFLDRHKFSNNFLVTKNGSAVSIKQVTSISELHHIQFNMLGNDLESIFLPSAIVIVEGESDSSFLAKLMQLYIPDRKVAIVRGGGDGGISEKINVIRDALGSLDANPYRNRVFVVLDKVHSVSRERIERQGVARENITVWPHNGIEYLYPQSLIAEAFCCDVEDVPKINLESNSIEYNGLVRSKKELSKYVSEHLSKDQDIAPSLRELITRIAASNK